MISSADAFLITAICLFSFGHPLGGLICALIALMGYWSE